MEIIQQYGTMVVQSIDYCIIVPPLCIRNWCIRNINLLVIT